MNKGRLLLFILIGWSAYLKAQTSTNAADIYWQMQKLKVCGSVLYIAAHPDDENTQLLTYLSKGKMYRTAYLSLTRGEGGQNLIGEEQGFELGLIRTQELLAARKIDGAEQFFTSAIDFGFSKRPEEALFKWNEKQVLAEMVFIIRKFQPDIIITRWPTTGEGGHGHHTASAILAIKAFEAAADPTKFPEQLKDVSVWKTKRLLWNTFQMGAINTTSPNQFKVDAGAYNPLLGKSYGEIAALSRSMHKTQAMGTAASRGADWEYFKTIAGTSPNTELLEGVNTNWSRMDQSGVIQSMIDKLISTYDLKNPQHSIPQLVQIYKKAKLLSVSNWQLQKIKELQDLIISCSGLYVEAISASPLAYKGDSINIVFSVLSRLNNGIKWLRAGIDTASDRLNKDLKLNVISTFNKTIKVDADISHLYNATVTLELEKELFDFSIPVQYKYTDPVRGELYQPLVVTFSKNERELLFRKEGDSLNGNGLSNKSDSLVMKEIKHNHIPTITYFKPIEKESPLPAIKTVGSRIGYIVGAGDKVPAALIKMGFDVFYIGEKELASASELQKYDAIITGVRAYNTQAWLLKNNKQLLNYVQQGGNLIVQYNTPDLSSEAISTIGPVPFVITKNRITDEEAVVKFLEPLHPLFHYPNEISVDDFKGWVQERSSYHAIDSLHQYTKLLSMADPNEAPQDESLLTIKYGKGNFSYVGLTLFRQLPAGVAGAYRLMANLIALNQKKGF